MKKMLVILVVFFSMMSDTMALTINSEHGVMYNLNDDKIIFEKNKDEITSIASLTKIMTTIVAIEQINDMNQVITVKKEMFKGLYEAEASVVGLVDSQKVTYEDLLYATFVASGADATRALTISLTGSEDKFVKLMNKKAKELSLKKTNFTNATGLDEEGQTATVDEIAQLLKYALKNDIFKEIFESKRYTFSDNSITINSTLYRTSLAQRLDISSIKGGKTGYTDDAGFALASVGYDEINNINYLIVTTKATVSWDNAYHIIDAIDMYDYYSSNYKYYNLINKNDEVVKLKVKYGKVKEVSVTYDKDIKHYHDNTFDKNKVKTNYIGKKTVIPFMKKGHKLGTADILYNGDKIETVDILLNEEVKFSIISFIFSVPFLIIVIIILLVTRILTVARRKSKKKLRRIKKNNK